MYCYSRERLLIQAQRFAGITHSIKYAILLILLSSSRTFSSLLLSHCSLSSLGEFLILLALPTLTHIFLNTESNCFQSYMHFHQHIKVTLLGNCEIVAQWTFYSNQVQFQHFLHKDFPQRTCVNHLSGLSSKADHLRLSCSTIVAFIYIHLSQSFRQVFNSFILAFLNS